MGSSFRSLPFLLFGSFTNVVVAGLGTVVAYSLAAAAAERDAERSFILGWFVGLWFPLSAQIGWISCPTGCSRPLALVHIRQSFVTCSRSNHLTPLNDCPPLPSIRLVFPHLPPSVRCPPNVAPYLRGISPAFFLLSVVARGEKVADSVRPSSRLSVQFSSSFGGGCGGCN